MTIDPTKLALARAYTRGVESIALNDDASENSLQRVSESISVATIADAFGKDPKTVARFVLKLRRAHWRAIGAAHAANNSQTRTA